jgi:hypothetical protein
MVLKGQQAVQAQVYQFPADGAHNIFNFDQVAAADSRDTAPVDSARRKAFSQTAYRKPYHGAGQNQG